MATAIELLSQDPPEDEDDLTYTDKQVGILRYALNHGNMEVSDIADETDASEAYVRSVLQRAHRGRAVDELDTAMPDTDNGDDEEPRPVEPPETEELAQELDVDEDDVPDDLDELVEQRAQELLSQYDEDVPDGVHVLYEKEVPVNIRITIREDQILGTLDEAGSLVPSAEQ